MKVAVVGAGISGSYFASLHNTRYLDPGFEITVLDMKYDYDYPCGEAIPIKNPVPYGILWKYVVHEIRVLEINVDGKRRVIDFGKVEGLIIDKKAFVKRRRELAEMYGDVLFIYERINDIRRLLKRFDLVVDARGPFSDSKEYDKLAVVQGFTNDVEVEEDTIYMYFNSNILGYFWIFPSARKEYKANIGFGATGIKNVVDVFKTIAKQHGISNIINLRGKKIKIVDPRKVAVDGRILRIGEAGGFIVPFTGEGIRPAIESAIELYNIILLNRRKGIKKIIKEFKKSNVVKKYSWHHRLYKMLKLIGPRRAARMLLRLEEDDFKNLLNGEISLWKLLRRIL